MNKETGHQARKSSLYSLSFREKVSESQPQTPSSKTKGSSSLSRDQSISSAQKLPEENISVKPQQDSTTAVRPQSSSVKQTPYKQHKRSTSDAHLNIYAGSPKPDRDIKGVVSPRSTKERASVLKRLVEPAAKGPSESSANIIQAKRNSQGSMPPSFCSESNTKKGSRPEIQGKEQECEPVRPLKGIIFQDLKKRLSGQEKVGETPKSKITQTPKNSFNSSLAKHKHGEYSPKVAPRSIVKDLSPRKRLSVGMMNEAGANTNKGIKAHDKGLSIGQMYIFTTEVEEKEKEGDKEEAEKKELFGLGKSKSEDKSLKKHTEQDQEKEKEKEKEKVRPKNVYERTLESDLENYKIFLDSNKQTFQFEKMMLEGRKARKNISFFGDAMGKKEQNGNQMKTLDIAGVAKNNVGQETCLSAHIKNPSTLDRLLSGQRPATCSTPRVENVEKERTTSSKENSDFEKLEKLVEAEEKARSGSIELESEMKGI